MSESHFVSETGNAPSVRGKADKTELPSNRRFTPLRSAEVTRRRPSGGGSERLSRLVPVTRFQN